MSQMRKFAQSRAAKFGEGVSVRTDCSSAVGNWDAAFSFAFYGGWYGKIDHHVDLPSKDATIHLDLARLDSSSQGSLQFNLFLRLR